MGSFEDLIKEDNHFKSTVIEKLSRLETQVSNIDEKLNDTIKWNDERVAKVEERVSHIKASLYGEGGSEEVKKSIYGQLADHANSLKNLNNKWVIYTSGISIMAVAIFELGKSIVLNIFTSHKGAQ